MDSLVRRQERFKTARRLYLLAYKAARGCLRCRERHVACLEFHRRDQPAKSSSLMSVGLSLSMEVLQAELAKCDVLCANCLRRLQFNQRTGRWRNRAGIVTYKQIANESAGGDAWTEARARARRLRRPLSAEESENPTIDPELM